MKTLFFLFALLLITITSWGTNYYVSASGQDASNGTSMKTAWLSIARVNSASFKAGDSILFRRGDTFYGTIMAKQSGVSGNPIVFGSYGSGSKPVITGFTKVSGWSKDGGGIYEYTCFACQLDLNMVTIADTLQPLGRYPKINAPANGYLYFQSFTGNSGLGSITSNAIASAPNFVGGEVAIRKNAWTIGRERITGQTSTTVSYYSLRGSNPYPPVNNFGFFFQNHVNALSANGDWMYDSTTKKIKIYSSTGRDTVNVKAATLPYIVKTASNYIVFNGLTFSGCDTSAIYTTNSSHNVTIQNCTIEFAGMNGIISQQSAQGLAMYNDSVLYSADIAINADFCPNWIIDSCVIMNAGMIRGMGRSGGENYAGIYNTGHDALIEYNRILNVGYIGIRFQKDSCLIYRNFVDSFDVILGDGGGIYTFSDSSLYGRIVRGNIVLYGLGDPYGTSLDTTNPHNRTPVHGIYFDANASHAIVDSNTAAFCGYGGIEINTGAHDLNIHNNTFYNNHNDQGDVDATVSTPTHIIFKHNLCFSLTADQVVFQFTINGGATYNTMGTFDSNYYCRPISEPKGINTHGYSHFPNWAFPSNDGGTIATNNGNHFYSLDTWQPLSGQDSHSAGTPFSVKETSKIRFELNPSALKRKISLGNNKYKDVYNAVYSGTLELPPYSSVILIPVGE